jgi:hypothetical protein
MIRGLQSQQKARTAQETSSNQLYVFLTFASTSVDETVLRVFALVIAIGGGVELMRRLIRWCWRLGKSWERIDVATRQLVPNGGTSVKDQIGTIAIRQLAATKVLDEVQTDVRALTQRADTLERRLQTLSETQVVDGYRLNDLEHKEH